MKVRPATPNDISTIARLGRVFHAQAAWGDVVDYNEADCAASLKALMQSDAFLCHVAEDDGQIVGMASGMIAPIYFNYAHKSGEELFWWVSDKAPQATGLRLLAALEASAKDAGCQSWQMKSLAKLNGDRMGRLYERRGYRASENSYIKRFN